MPFFRKKRPTSLAHEQPNTNGSSSKAGTPTWSNPTPVSLPPLHGFVSPTGKTAHVILKETRRGTSTVEEVLSWGRDYFSAFLRSEGADHVFSIWERIGAIREDYPSQDFAKSAKAQSNVINDEMLRMKFQLEKSSSFSCDFSVLSCEENENNVYRWLISATELIYQTLQEDYLPKFLESKFYIKCQVDYFTNNDGVSLHDILNNHSALFYFMEYVDQESNREVLEFWVGAKNFSEQFLASPNTQDTESVIDVKVAQSDAMVLYEKYISLQAPQFLGFRDEIRCDVERLICSNEEISQCFDRAKDEAFLFLHVTCLDGFLKSSLFLAFLSDLINSLSPPAKTHKRSESTSTCSSSSASITSPVVNSSTSSLHKSSKTKLSLGRVNSMGKFEADTDLELLKQESGLAKTVKKLVNFDEKEKAKEELAWQVAAMIVNEITSITMGTGEASSIAQ